MQRSSTVLVEVTNISVHGFWLFLDGRELFVSFRDFPWFADAPVKKIANVTWPSPNQLRWPDLDIDLSVDSIEHPERFPLLFEPHPGT
jgi:Protein of unknown function (DUF2442)